MEKEVGEMTRIGFIKGGGWGVLMKESKFSLLIPDPSDSGYLYFLFVDDYK